MNDNYRQRFWQLCALFLLALAFHIAGTWILPLVDRDETYYAEVSREMKDRGDYIVPRFNNKIWLEKPPLLYWCQSGCYWLFGDNDFAARFPGALASSLTALVILEFCASLYDRRTAWRAAISFTVCSEMLLFGKAGITDMPAVLFTTLAAWAGWEILKRPLAGAENPGAGRWWWIFYLSLAGAFLAKGPLAVLPLGGLFVFWRWAKVPAFFRVMKFGFGIGLASFVVALWFVPAQLQTHGQLLNIFVGQQIIERSIKVSQGHGGSTALTYFATLPFYFIIAFAAFFPWSIWFGRAFRRIREQRSPADLYLVSGILVTFILFSVVRTKLPHYTLPAFPLIACAVAPVIPDGRLIRWSAGMVFCNLALSFGLFPLAASYSAPKKLGEVVLQQRNTSFAAVEYQEPSLIWYLRKHLDSWKTQLKPQDVEAYMREPGPRICVSPSKLMAELPPDSAWRVITARGFSIDKGKFIELSMAVKAQ